MLKLKNATKECMRWIIGKGMVDFWHDRWWGDDKLTVNSYAHNSLTVKDALSGDIDNVGLNPNLIGAIKEMNGLLHNEEDIHVWIASMNINFSIKYA